MQVRTTIIDLFSTFIQFSADRFEQWVTDRRLHRHMEQHFKQNPEAVQTEGFWALYWYKLWCNQDRQAAAHLSAYLQEPCYWAARRITRQFNTVNCSLADGFQIAIAQTERLLKGYRPDYGLSLKAYAHAAFSNLIRDQLRQQQELNICSDWGLLRRISQTQLTQSLQAAGTHQPESTILAWKCFKAIYIPPSGRLVRALPSPTPEQFAQISSRYNQLRLRLQPVPPRLEVSALVATLEQGVQAVRAYLNPTVTSLHQPCFDETAVQWLDSIGSDDIPLHQLLAAEAYTQQQQRQEQLGTVLSGAVMALGASDQTLLRLYYGDNLPQREIAQRFQMKQYQVSRQLSRVRQQLLLTVATWSQEALQTSITSTELAGMSDIIHEWLQHHFQPNPSYPEIFSEPGF
jgi:RNA polymerase sigma factor (sigma-70 family)